MTPATPATLHLLPRFFLALRRGLVVCLCLLATATLYAEPRQALVMGVWKYTDPTFPSLPETGGQADVEGMRKALAGLGFSVTVVTNPTLSQAKKAVDDFGAAIKRQPGTALFYFSGHGSEYDGKNFLIPSGTSIVSNRTLDDEALNAGRILDVMEENQGFVNIVFLDCCRNSLSKSGGGLASMSARGSFIGYATRSGKTAQTSLTGSLYTGALVKHLATPGQSIDDMHTRVAREVQALDPTMYPGKYSELVDVFYFRAGAGVPAANVPAPPTASAITSTMPIRPSATVLPPARVGSTMQLTLPSGEKITFCYCPPGSFTMGSPPGEKDRLPHEQQVRVRLSKGFWMAQTECTQGQWQDVMGSNPSKFVGSRDFAVTNVNWDETQSFISNLNGRIALPSGYRLSLPTEAQWEYACRAGTETAFAFGDSLTPEVASAGDRQPGARPKTVGSYPGNRWGLKDMHGGVFEWCLDLWDWSSNALGGTDPLGTSGTYRCCRGGAWVSERKYCRSAHRDRALPSTRGEYMGFRLALVPSGP